MQTFIVNVCDAYDIYIGRPGRGHEGYFGNPFRLKGADRLDLDAIERCLNQFQGYLFDRLASDPEFHRRVLELKGKRLACFCAPRGKVLTAADRPWRCHGQVYAAWLDEQEESR